MNVKYFSCDVFDTALIRGVAATKDVFLLMQEEMDAKGYSLPKEVLGDFPRKRVIAEQKARTLKRSREVNLDEIYAYFQKSHHVDDQLIQWVKELELKTELDNLYPVDYTKSILNRARNEGYKILFVSDTYFSVNTLEKFLDQCGCRMNGDEIYSSSERGVSKKTGDMFRLLLKEKGIRPSELCHLGDNPVSDILVPQRLGIKVLYKTNVFELANFAFNFFKEYVLI